MYEYKFVKVKLDRMWLFERKPQENYYEVIRKHAGEGWRLVQIFGPSVSVIDGGTPNYFELIFEREIK